MRAKIFATRRRGRPRARWMDQVVVDMHVVEVEGWGTLEKRRCLEFYRGGRQGLPRAVVTVD